MQQQEPAGEAGMRRAAAREKVQEKVQQQVWGRISQARECGFRWSEERRRGSRQLVQAPVRVWVFER